MVPLGKAGVGHHETAAVEHVVADEAVYELGDSLGEGGAAALQLFERLGQPMADLDIAACEGSTQLDLMVARDAERTAGSHHGHDNVEHFGDAGAAVDQIAEKHRSAAFRMRDGVGTGVVAQPVEQTQQLVMAAVDIADEVEWAGVAAAVAPDPGASHLDTVEFLDRAERVDPGEAFLAQPLRAAAQGLVLALDGVRGRSAIPALLVVRQALGDTEIKDDRGGQHIPPARQLEEGLAVLGLRVGGIDHREAADLKTLVNDGVEQLEGGRGDGLVGLVVADQGSTSVARHDFGGGEVPASERRLARAGCAAEHDQPDLGYLDAVESAPHACRLIG